MRATLCSARRAFTSRLSNGRLVAIAICAVIASMAVPSILPGTKPVTVRNLVRQLEGKAYYWNRLGEKPGIGEHIARGFFPTQSKVTAARMLGELGPAAVQAVPALLSELENGTNDIETGDGVIPIRSAVAIALGRIGDKRAIGPLTDKLKVKEKAGFHSGYSGGTHPYEPTGVGHLAIIQALGMFGPDAKPAIPFILALNDGADPDLRETIAVAIGRIEDGP